MPHLYDVMTSWAVVVDVYYLPAMKRKETHTAAEFADEVELLINY
jgi:hypothetical protein